MTAITDKFGKASIDTSYALATTVKTARTEGETVLACYDLSRFAPDTPVFFVTYKKTTDPTTNEVTVTNQTSWKALANPDNNTLTNLTLAPGYEDIGNDIGDYVECIPTSFWGNELVEGLFVSINPDGTLKTSAVEAALGITDNPVGYTPMTPAVTSIAHLGDHMYDVTFAASVADTLTPGMRGYGVRNVAANGMCADFEASSAQYATRPSANLTGMTFNDDWTFEVQIKVENLSGSYQYIAGRRSGAPGWGFILTPSGELMVFANNGSVEDQIRTYRCPVPGEWVHVAFTWDMSASAWKMFVDGSEVISPSLVASAAVSFGQAGDFRLGASSTPSEYFDGKMKEARLWSLIRTPAQIKDNMSQSIDPTTPGLVGYWKMNGDFNDSTTNNNHLTPMNGATTVADAPWGTQADGTIANKEYFIVNKVAGNVATVQVARGCHLPTSGGVSAMFYSTVKTPFGFPSDEDRWTTTVLYSGVYQKDVASASTYYHTPMEVTFPVGVWKAIISASYKYGGTSVAAAISGIFAFSDQTTEPNTVPVNDYDTILDFYKYMPNVALQSVEPGFRQKNFTIKTPTKYRIIGRCAEAAGAFHFQIKYAVIRYTNAYL